MEVSAYDDASDDGSDEALRAWAPALRARRRHGDVGESMGARRDGGPAAAAGGIGHAKNAAVAQSTGEFLVFLTRTTSCFRVAWRRRWRSRRVTRRRSSAGVGGVTPRVPPNTTSDGPTRWMIRAGCGWSNFAR